MAADSTHIKQILLNIIGNAVKYTPEGGVISCVVRELPALLEQHAHYSFIISDNGPGIAQALLPKIFDMFERGGDSRTSKIEGTGLGLAICKNLTNLMGGTIEADNAPRAARYLLYRCPCAGCVRTKRSSCRKPKRPATAILAGTGCW